jgi:hypothetical protein
MIKVELALGIYERDPWQCGSYLPSLEVYGTGNENSEMNNMRDQVLAEILGWA